ncbi:hypothetical protein IL54_3685 [Sphingobium sp. ba1]|nr:hypothetical protein IL54_3685 [Sphingobium sp. ba1]
MLAMPYAAKPLIPNPAVKPLNNAPLIA